MTEALRVVEDSDLSSVSYFPAGGWIDRHGAGFEMFHGGSYHVTNVAGGGVTFKFTGSYVAYYSDMNSDHDRFRVSVDGGPAQTDSSYAPRWTNGSRLLFATPLSPGPHTLTITNVKAMWMGLDYFMYLPVKPPPSVTRSTAASTTTTRTSTTTTRRPTSSAPPSESTQASTSTTEIVSSSTDPAFLPQSDYTATSSDSSTALPSADHLSSSLTPAPSSRPQSEEQSGISPAILYAVIGVACAVLLGFVVALAIFFRRRRQRRRLEAELAQPPPAYSEADAWSAIPVGSDDGRNTSQAGSPMVESTPRLSTKSGGSRY